MLLMHFYLQHLFYQRFGLMEITRLRFSDALVPSHPYRSSLSLGVFWLLYSLEKKLFWKAAGIYSQYT